MAVDLGLDTKLASLEANKGKEAEFMEDLVDVLNSAARSDNTPFGSASKARLATQTEVDSRTGNGLVQAKHLGSFGGLSLVYVGSWSYDVRSHSLFSWVNSYLIIPGSKEWFLFETDPAGGNYLSGDLNIRVFSFINAGELYAARQNSAIRIRLDQREDWTTVSPSTTSPRSDETNVDIFLDSEGRRWLQIRRPSLNQSFPREIRIWSLE